MAHVIEVKALGKHYPIGSRSEGYLTLRESLSSLHRRRSRRNRDEGIWALQDVGLTVEEGEVVGVIGPNGAGKTTLLKILTRITEPTTGVTRTRGRVGALLEVGTGFHPELTGRENVYLNGAILGMRQREIRAKFDEIVEFSEIERFIDTPVKHYSSGMHMRLAFAVAAHLEPEILVVDEVLAVGDAAFQKKCLGKMDDVAHEGRTVLFVSHNTIAIGNICSRAVWLSEGRVVDTGPATEMVSRYMRAVSSGNREALWGDPDIAPGNDHVRLRSARVRPAAGSTSDSITTDTPFVMEFEYSNGRPGAVLNLSIHLYNSQGILVFNATPAGHTEWYGREFPVGSFRDVCEVPGGLLNNDTYRVELLVVRDESVVLFEDSNLLTFEVEDPFDAPGIYSGYEWHGVVRPRHIKWSTELLYAGTAHATQRSEAAGESGRR
jgi:lipopolysaccharide transport system ATP-binding protein